MYDRTPLEDRCNPIKKHQCSDYCMKRQKLIVYHGKWFEVHFGTYLHSIFCFIPSLCSIKGCSHASKLFHHTIRCPEREYGTCHFCRPMMLSFAANHTKFCYQGDNCAYPYCRYIRRRKEAKLPLFKVFKKEKVVKEKEKATVGRKRSASEHPYELRPRKIIKIENKPSDSPGLVGVCNLPAGIVYRPARPSSPQVAANVTRLVLIIMHAHKCRRLERAKNKEAMECRLDLCRQLKDTLTHMETCPPNVTCPEKHCSNMRTSWFHWKNCGMHQNCPICVPVVQILRNASRYQKRERRRRA